MLGSSNPRGQDWGLHTQGQPVGTAGSFTGVTRQDPPGAEGILALGRPTHQQP